MNLHLSRLVYTYRLVSTIMNFFIQNPTVMETSAYMKRVLWHVHLVRVFLSFFIFSQCLSTSAFINNFSCFYTNKKNPSSWCMHYNSKDKSQFCIFSVAAPCHLKMNTNHVTLYNYFTTDITLLYGMFEHIIFTLYLCLNYCPRCDFPINLLPRFPVFIILSLITAHELCIYLAESLRHNHVTIYYVPTTLNTAKRYRHIVHGWEMEISNLVHSYM